MAIKKDNGVQSVWPYKKQQHALQLLQQIAKKQGGESLSTTYTRGKDKYTFRCANGHEWQTTGVSIKSSKTWCPICRYDKHRRSLTDLHALATARGGLCLAKYYTTMNDKVMWQCAKGHRWQHAASFIQRGYWCPY